MSIRTIDPTKLVADIASAAPLFQAYMECSDELQAHARALFATLADPRIDAEERALTAMTLADVLPALQQGAIDGSLTTITQYTTLHYIDAAKYVVETGQPYVSSIAVLSKKWVEGLPPDLQKIVRDDALKVSADIVPFINQFFDTQRKVWTDSGGSLTSLPEADQAAFMSKISSIGLDVSASKPDLNAAIKVVMASAAKNK